MPENICRVAMVLLTIGHVKKDRVIYVFNSIVMKDRVIHVFNSIVIKFIL